MIGPRKKPTWISWYPVFSVVCFSRGTLPPKKKKRLQGHELLGDLVEWVPHAKSFPCGPSLPAAMEPPMPAESSTQEAKKVRGDFHLLMPPEKKNAPLVPVVIGSSNENMSKQKNVSVQVVIDSLSNQ